MEDQSTAEVICGQCGEKMETREVTPCLDCGGLQGEMAEFKNGKRTFFKEGFFKKKCFFVFLAGRISLIMPRRIMDFRKGSAGRRRLKIQV